MKKAKILMMTAAAVLCILLGFLAARAFYREKEATVSTTAIEEKLEQCSDLTTVRLDYRGLVQYSEGEIPLINKKGFSMIYDAQIRAGIDLSQAEINVSGSVIHITLPEPVIQNVTINPDTVQFYDSQYSLFNWTDKEDVTTALEYAEQDALERTDSSDLLAQAKDQARAVIETLLVPITDTSSDSYQIEIN